MEAVWLLFLVPFFTINSLDKAESVKVFDEIFGEGWWDNDKAEEWHKLTLEYNFHHQIDQQITPQLGQIEPKNPPLKNSDHSGQIEPNSTDQNPTLTESDKRKIIDKFHAMKDDFKQKGNYSNKEWIQIDNKIAKHLKVNRSKIYKWKKELGISGKMFNENEERQNLVEKFDRMKAELKRAGFKSSYKNEINETVAKELGITYRTIYAWKSELGQTKPNKYPHSEQKELMKRYYEIKGKNPKFSDENIAKMLKIGSDTLYRWKKQFKRHQFHPGHSLAENAGSNDQEN